MTAATKKLPSRKTKIVATLGPASNSPEIISKMIQAGMDVARLNFSHGTHEDHTRLLQMVREESQKLGRPIAVFQDLCGPKLRVEAFDGGGVFLEVGHKVSLQAFQGSPGDKDNIFISTFDPTAVLRPGEKVLLSDGLIELKVLAVKGDRVECVVVDGGHLRSRAGIVVPESELQLPCLTEKDFLDIEWAVAHDIDYVALSFVNSAKDILDLRRHIEGLGKKLPIIAKFERASSLDDVTAIVGVSNAVMVARGDLGLELPLERVPPSQRLIIETANHEGTPVITATQMLSSMVNEMRPTRAEVSDVFSAVLDGTDGVMLSEETTIGKYPAEAVGMLSRITEEAERDIHLGRHPPRFKSADRASVADAVCYAANGAADKIAATAILACTRSGYTARLMAKYRPQQMLFGATSDPRALRRMALYWGVEPVHVPVEEQCSTEEEVVQAMLAVRDRYGLKPGARVVITAGLKASISGTTSLVQIREIPRS